MGSSEVASEVMRLSARDIELIKQHGAEAFRECAILWFVFAALDKLVANSITVPWLLWNFCGSIVFWILGIYIEAKRRS